MHSNRYGRRDRSRVLSLGAQDLPERHPRLSLNWSDPTGRTHTSVLAVQGIPVLFVEGDFTGRTAKPCREAVDAVLRMRPTLMVVDLGGVRETDATTVGLLDAMRKFANWHGIDLCLAAVPVGITTRLEGARSVARFETHTSSERAVGAALSRPRAARRPRPEERSRRSRV